MLVVVVFLLLRATNIPQSIDPALLRTGRFDKKIYVPVPDLLSRTKLFSIILEKKTSR
ncbi:AAA family ATPase [Photobacterium leiognathi]|uniref:AAA family ATPase n=1 Tax=Photobacterium leiognathi TaxID=553611 RepID=UPI0034E4051A